MSKAEEKKLLITGAAGFIGSNFVFYLLKAHPEYKIVCADALTYAGNPENLRRAKGKIGFYQVDISKKDAVNRMFEEERFDVVVNFAAESHVDRSIEQPEVFLTANVLGTHTLLEACRLYGIDRFHQISTDEIYGDLPLERLDLSFEESSPIRASSPYSASKAAADLLALAYHRTYKLPVTISRCSNNYGPFQFPEKLIPMTIIRALRGENIPVYGTGLNTRDWIFVEDHCAAVDLILQKGKAGEVYNVGARCELSNLEVVRSILRELRQPEELISFVPDRPGHDLRYSVNPRKIETELGWRPETEWKDGLHRTICWYLNHKGWWEDILSGGYRNKNCFAQSNKTRRGHYKSDR